MQKHSLKRKVSHHEYDLHADLEKIKSAFTDTAHDVKGKAADMISQSIDTVRERSATVQDNVVNYIQDKPLTAVGFAALAGAIFGFMLHRK
jgi:ElaB/YqjD/DUF883 family membrane-anchored ribosome-binding protein